MNKLEGHTILFKCELLGVFYRLIQSNYVKTFDKRSKNQVNKHLVRISKSMFTMKGIVWLYISFIYQENYYLKILVIILIAYMLIRQ